MPLRTDPISYFGSRAGQAFNNAASQVGAFINSLSAAVQRSTIGMRQEVPFERWYFDHGLRTPIEDFSSRLQARGWAMIAVAEGTVRTLAEVICFVFSKVFEPSHSDRHLSVLKAQWTGLRLSLLAVAAPNYAKSEADNNGNPIIGSFFLNWHWGTPYTGKLDIPFWHIECSQYPWAT